MPGCCAVATSARHPTDLGVFARLKGEDNVSIGDEALARECFRTQRERNARDPGTWRAYATELVTGARRMLWATYKTICRTATPDEVNEAYREFYLIPSYLLQMG